MWSTRPKKPEMFFLCVKNALLCLESQLLQLLLILITSNIEFYCTRNIMLVRRLLLRQDILSLAQNPPCDIFLINIQLDKKKLQELNIHNSIHPYDVIGCVLNSLSHLWITLKKQVIEDRQLIYYLQLIFQQRFLKHFMFI